MGIWPRRQLHQIIFATIATGTVCSAAGQEQYPHLYLPRLGQASIADEWSGRGFSELHLPVLGETIKIEREINDSLHLFPGVGFNVPEFPRGKLPVGVRNSNDVYERNRMEIVNGYYPLESWASAQGRGGKWDYKRDATQGQPGWVRMDMIGYFNSGYAGAAFLPYAGAALLSKGEIVALVGAYKVYDQRGLYGNWRQWWQSELRGNKPTGFLYLEMGADYVNSGQHIIDFIDAAPPTPDTPGSVLQLRQLKAILRRSADEEYTLRMQRLLRNLARENNEVVAKVVINAEQERQQQLAAELERQRQEEEEERRRREAMKHAPGPGIPSEVPTWRPAGPATSPSPIQPIRPSYLTPVQPPPPYVIPIPKYRFGGPGGPARANSDCGDVDCSGPIEVTPRN
jgi:hypothetical protein